MKKLIIAIDGYAATGKSTTAKSAARILNYTFIDTGAMYRAVTLFFLRKDIAFDKKSEEMIAALEQMQLEFRPNPETGRRDMYLNGENVEKDIRAMEVSAVVSEVSTISAVRRRMVALQREMAAEGGIVMDGRDIGTVVFPDADLKFFLTATMEVRVQRRQKEYALKGKTIDADTILENLKHRDHIDSTRADSPLRKAEDAIEIDTTNITIEEQVEFVVRTVKEKIGKVPSTE